MMRSPYYSDAEYYMQGKIIIATIAIIIWINFVLFIISFILGLIDFLKRCPHCLCCICNKKHLRKDQIIIDQEFPIDKGPIDQIEDPPTPIPSPPPTPPPPPREPTPTPSPPSPPPPPKIPTPESSEDEAEVYIPASAVLVKDGGKFEDEKSEEDMEQTMANT